MPIYEYRCPNGHQFEVFQAISDDPASVCQECGEPVERVFHPIAVHFKGSGFYTTDYARKTRSKGAESTDGKESKDAGSETKSESSDSKPDKKKTESASSSGKDD